MTQTTPLTPEQAINRWLYFGWNYKTILTRGKLHQTLPGPSMCLNFWLKSNGAATLIICLTSGRLSVISTMPMGVW